MTNTKIFVALPLLLAALTGCHSDAAKSPTEPAPSSATTQTTPQGCDAIADPAAAEDCRFRAEVLKKRQKSNASPVVKHSPGTIQQP